VYKRQTLNNNFTHDEEQFIEQLASTLRRAREAESIRNSVSSKIASTDFSSPTGFMQTAAGKIMVIGSLVIISTLMVMLVTTKQNNNLTHKQPIVNAVPETSETVLKNTEQTTGSITESKIEKEVTTVKKNTNKEKDGGAVVGLPIASSESVSSKVVNTHLNELSFLEVYTFDEKAELREFKKDLKAQLDRMDIQFSDKSNKDEVINFVSQKTKGVDEQQRPVIFYITAKVDKRFPGNLKMSLRYYPNESGDFDGGDITINSIFYNNLKSRVSGLINWKYKPNSIK